MYRKIQLVRIPDSGYSSGRGLPRLNIRKHVRVGLLGIAGGAVFAQPAYDPWGTTIRSVNPFGNLGSEQSARGVGLESRPSGKTLASTEAANVVEIPGRKALLAAEMKRVGDSDDFAG
jgi:hypothetical protein